MSEITVLIFIILMFGGGDIIYKMISRRQTRKDRELDLQVQSLKIEEERNQLLRKMVDAVEKINTTVKEREFDAKLLEAAKSANLVGTEFAGEINVLKSKKNALAKV